MKLLPLQGHAAAWLRPRHRAILGLPQGMGKTVVALEAARGYGRMVVICPASMKGAWAAEHAAWEVDTPLEVYSYDEMRLGKVPPRDGIDVLIADEAHRLKSPAAARTKVFAKLRKLAARVWFLTGTPMPNRPIELWPVLKMCDALPEQYSRYHDFGLRYASAHKDQWDRWVYKGKSNLDELSRHLAPIMYRLSKDELNLPEKSWALISLDGDRLVEAGELELSELPIDRKVLDITKASEIRKLCALAKLPAAVRYIRDALEDDEGKIIVFAHHAEVVATLTRELARYNPAVISGLTAPKRRAPMVQKFQTDPSCRVFIGNIAAAGEGITLTASNRVIFAEPSWSWAELDQASDRAHRIGQKLPVFVEVLALRGSLDERMLRRCLEKLNTAARVVRVTETTPTPQEGTMKTDPITEQANMIAAELRKLLPVTPDGNSNNLSFTISVDDDGVGFNLSLQSYPRRAPAVVLDGTPTPAAVAPQDDKPAPKAKPAKAEKPKDDPKDEPAAKAYSRDDIRALAIKLATQKGRPSVTGILSGVGAAKIDDIKEEDFAAVAETISELLGG